MRANEFINEERGGYLYHGMPKAKAITVFANDSMPANWQSNIPGVGRINGNSFSRNKLYGTEYSYGGYLVQLTVDQTKLAQTHKMIPVNAERVYRLAATNNNRRELGKPEQDIANMPSSTNDRFKRDPRGRMDEEFVVGDINNLHKYVVAISLIDSNDARRIDPASAFMLTNYCKKYNIQLNGPDFLLDAVKKAASKANAQIKKNSLGKYVEIPGGGTVADYYSSSFFKHPDKATIAKKWDNLHANAVNPAASAAYAEYEKQKEAGNHK